MTEKTTELPTILIPHCIYSIFHVCVKHKNTLNMTEFTNLIIWNDSFIFSSFEHGQAQVCAFCWTKGEAEVVRSWEEGRKTTRQSVDEKWVRTKKGMCYYHLLCSTTLFTFLQLKSVLHMSKLIFFNLIPKFLYAFIPQQKYYVPATQKTVAERKIYNQRVTESKKKAGRKYNKLNFTQTSQKQPSTSGILYLNSLIMKQHLF